MIILAATPIGNLADASRRLVEALETATVIAAEDTRTAQRLMAGLGVTNRPQLIALHDHNEKHKAAEVVERARDTDILVISEAGMPTVSDPGYALVVAAAEAGVTVTAIPGPSAVITALAVSGLPTDRFSFEGFLPRKSSERRATFAAVAREKRTMVFFESPNRIADSLKDAAISMGENRRAVVARELTKMFEEVRRGTLTELAEWASEGVRGEICLVIAGADDLEVPFGDALIAVQTLVTQGARLKEACSQVASDTGASSRELYQAALAARSSMT